MPFIDKSPLSYMPNTATPIRRYALDRAPTSSDYKSFKVGDEWLDKSSIDWWKLCDKDTTSGTWKKMAGTGGPVETFPVDSGTSPVIPNAANEVTLAGGTGITTVGSLNTVTVDLDADVAQQYTADAGSAVPAANNLDVLGGTSIDTAGAGDTVTINASGDIANQYVTDAGTAAPVLNSLNVLGGTGLDTTGVGDTVTVNASGEVATQYTADAGTATPALNNINIVGGTGVGTVGAGSTITINADTGFAPITKYVVDPDGSADYITIQAALDAANVAGFDAVIYARPATYTENLTLYGGMVVQGATIETIISGNHTPPASGSFTFKNVYLLAASGDIFSSLAAGTSILLCDNCYISVVNGYIYDVLNWAGVLAIVNCTDSSTNNGIINNTGTATALISSSFAGRGTGNVCTFSNSNLDIISSRIACSIAVGGTSTVVINEGSSISGNLSTADTADVFITNTKMNTGAVQAITHNSSNTISLADVNINTSNNPAIGGTGTVEFGSVTYCDDSNIAGTLTGDYTTALETGTAYLNNISFDRGTNTVDTDGELIIGNTAGVPQVNTLTAGTGISIVNGGGSITINATATGLAWVNATGATQAMVEDTAYGANNAGGVTFTLPATATEGSVIEIVGIQGLWSLAQNAGQTVYSGDLNTTTGVGGSLTALNAGGCIVLRCIVADTDFRVQSMMENLTIV